MEMQPYRSNEENLRDYIQLFTLCLTMSGSDRQASALAEISALWEQIGQQEAVSGAQVGLTLPALRQALSLNDCHYFCVAFALCCELDGFLRNEVQKQCLAPLPTFDFAFSLYSAFRRAALSDFFCCPNPNISSLRFALRLEAGFLSVQPLLATPLLLRRNILHFLVSGFPPQNKYYTILDCLGFDALPLHTAVYCAANAYLCDVSAGAAHLYFFLLGASGTGKRTLVKRLCATQKIPCVFLDCNSITGLDEVHLEQLSIDLSVDLALSGAMLCICNCPAEHTEQILALLRALPPAGVPLFVLCEKDNAAPPPIDGRVPLVHSLSALSGAEYDAAWEHLRSLHPAEPALTGMTPDYRLTIGQMEQAWVWAAHFCRCEGRAYVCAQDIASAVRQMNAPSGYATPISSTVTFDDMVVSEDTMARLRLICDFARQNRTVYRDWGFATHFSYGRGITALLCGASGTGKTMAAAAIANELGVDLLRLDLSQIIDKYIGETEKKLAAVFDTASRGNYILFFDEADALFSKRTEISSSHDRYANMETSFLLQSIEQYDGIVLLATNLFKNFDEAFLRRIGVIARFSLPDEALRLKLWKSVFPPQTPLSPGLDFALLARELELSPAIIKNAARTAAVRAASERGEVDMRHLIFGLRCELEKFGQESRLTALTSLI